jgi:hypothetical protein
MPGTSGEPHEAHTGIIVSTPADAEALNRLLAGGLVRHAWAYEFGFSFCGRRLNDILVLGVPPEKTRKWIYDWVNEDLLTCLTPEAYERIGQVGIFSD